ncbi:uncharacterized protein ATC70_005588 [Mucor velutinosus]|uniref:C2H2-type domain-containing protein n=1 Tax=Mucor velutinosus TaxID=708070 RepID=A0AAN7DBM2_9FUNG|nr:hypothetical protein ATC70_005588 [Mucor velutinosus]
MGVSVPRTKRKRSSQCDNDFDGDDTTESKDDSGSIYSESDADESDDGEDDSCSDSAPVSASTIKTEVSQKPENVLGMTSSEDSIMGSSTIRVFNQSENDERVAVNAAYIDYYCRACDVYNYTFEEFTHHLQQAHNLKTTRKPSTLIKHDDLEPDVHDPNNYFRSCERTYPIRGRYRVHLRSVHRMVLKPLLGKDKQLPDILPNATDTNNYCRACNIKKKTKGAYRMHLRHYHRMKLLPHNGRAPDDPSIKPNPDDPNFYCCVCDITKRSIEEYHSHLYKKHNMMMKRPFKEGPNANPNLEPEVESLDFYCNTCDRKFADRNTYRLHLKNTHKMTLNPPRSRKSPNVLPDWYDPNNYCRNSRRPLKKPKTELPDEDDPNFYCSVCQTTKSPKQKYRQYCREVHHMTLRAFNLGPRANPDILPDLTDANNYCRACDKTVISAKAYRRHILSVHKWNEKLPPLTNVKRRRDITSKLDDPNYRCRAYDKLYDARGAYRAHLKYSHGMEFPSESQKCQQIPGVEPELDDPNFFLSYIPTNICKLDRLQKASTKYT